MVFALGAISFEHEARAKHANRPKVSRESIREEFAVKVRDIVVRDFLMVGNKKSPD